MRYELIKGSCAGVIIDPTPVLRDIKDTFEVSFLLPFEGTFIALFRSDDGGEHKAVIKDGVVKIPKELLTKEQTAGLTVCQIDGEHILQSWECSPLKIGAFLYMRKTQWQIAAADKDILARFAELERVHAQALADFAALKAAASQHGRETAELVAQFKLGLYEQGQALASAQKDSANLAGAHNKAIEVINDLSKRVTALEKNYDPTLIK